MKQLKVEDVIVTERGVQIVMRDDRTHVPTTVYCNVDAEWMVTDGFARALDRAARRIRAREAEVDPSCCDVAMF